MLASVACLAAAHAAGGTPRARAGSHVWDTRPRLDQIYAGYRPAFATGDPQSGALKFSRQRHYLNMGDVQMDAQVRPIIVKADETAFEKKEYRKAAELYRRIITDYPNDMIQIASEGVFVPAAFHVQRQILRYPKKELDYYRVLYDPAARDIYERARKRYSIFDYKELAAFHLATSYGDDALFALANNALDRAQYDEARRYYERILTYHGLEDEDRDAAALDRDQVWARLAICYRHLGKESDFRAAVARIQNKKEAVVTRLLGQLERFQYDAFAVHQREGRRSARYDAMDDRKLAEPMPYEFSANRGEWRVALPRRSHHDEPEALPWATETDLIYKDRNVLYSRSLLTGELNWAFGPGGTSRDWDDYGGGRGRAAFLPNQSILVQDGVVLAHMFVYGPSLVAVDQYTGKLLWAKGPMAATSEDEWLDRYQASPAAGRGMVVVPVVHDDIRGRAHISSSAELAAFETRTGRRLWQTRLSQISPLRVTQSRYPRKIRIFSTPPLVHGSSVYHVTNAGVVACVDADTGDVRWLSRYPQNRRVLDNLTPPGAIWRNEPPVLRGTRLYVTPVDSEFLLCLDTETGRILWEATQSQDSGWAQRHVGKRHRTTWRLIGITATNELYLAGDDNAFLDPITGRLRWRWGAWAGWSGAFSKPKLPPKGLEPAINGEGDDFWCDIGYMNCRPTLTRDGKAYFALTRYIPSWPAGPYNSEYCLDLKERAVTLQRRWFSPVTFVNDHQRNVPVAKRVVNEEPEPFYDASRMSFTRWGIPFEVDVTYAHIVVRYDRRKLEKVLATGKTLDTLFAKAEVARKRGDIQKAIRQYEDCKLLLPSEEENHRKNINLRLYPLYTELARWGHQSADYEFLEKACKKMGATASSPGQEIRALLAYAELHEREKRPLEAIRVLQNASRHYWREAVPVSGLELGRRSDLLDAARNGLAKLLGEVPPPYREQGKQLLTFEQAALNDYFLAVANVNADYVLEARSLVAKRIREALGRASRESRREYDKLAREDLQRYARTDVGERLLWCWPESEAAKRRIQELAGNAADLKPAERQVLHWRLADLAGACGLGEKLVPKGRAGLLRVPMPSDLPAGEGMKPVSAKNEDLDMVRLALPQTGAVKETAHLLFVGGRKKRAYGNRFTVMCWNMKENRKEWLSREILLHGKVQGEEGYEIGFEKVFLYGDLAIVYGRHDVIALDYRPGTELDANGKKEKHWHFRVPLGFEIVAADLCGDVLVLCGRSSTVTLSPRTGDILWDAAEAGEFYAGPFFDQGVVLTVRRSPAEVSFRRVGSGRLLCRLGLPGLTTNRKHPAYSLEGGGGNPAAAEAAEASPVAFAERHLAVTDGRTYHVIDDARRRIRWSRRASKLDPSSDAAYRFWIDGGRLYVLKPYYAVLENAVFDLHSGDMLWRRREGGKKQDVKLKEYEAADAAEGGRAATGLVLSSMTFLDGKVYGAKYMMGTTSVALVGMNPVSGKEILSIKESGYEEPEAWVEPSWSKNCVVVHVQDGNHFELWQVDVRAGKIVQKLKVQGYGRLGEYGDVSMVWQGPYQAIWAFESRTHTVPAKRGKPSR